MPDPLASLVPVRVIITIADRDFVVEPKPAQDWLEILLAEEPDIRDIVPGWCGYECHSHLYRSLMNGSFDGEEWGTTVLEVIEVASGRRWWQAINMINAMKLPENWRMIFGQLVLQGLDPRQVSLGAWLDATYALCTQNMDKDDRIKFDLAIDTPPSFVKPEDAIDPAEQERAFMSLMQAVAGG